ncbi:MAG: hypothetical protein ACO1NU_10050 [Arcticibacter sp.]
MMYKNLLVLCFLLKPFIGSTQTSGIDSIPGAFERYRTSHLQEKIYAHIDRQTYLAGELLWFKLYNVDAVFNRPVDLSSVAYVELLDAQSNAVVQAKVSLKKGKGNGSLYLPVRLASGTYRIRAYTRWMRNFSAELFFEEDIRIINTLTEQASSEKVRRRHYDVQFFPEGGDLVPGVSSKVAFRAVDESGKGVNISGTIQDEQRHVVAEVRPGRFGIGNFVITPEAGLKYKALIRLPDGTSAEYSLPAARESGYRLAIGAANDQVVVDIASGNSDQSALYLFAHASNKVEFASKIVLNNGRAQVAIPEDRLHEGITHFTLFDSSYRPVSERLWFRLGASRLQLKAASDQEEYEQRKKVTMDIQTSLAGAAVSADLSVAVYRADSLQQGLQPGIAAYLLLSSELKGTVEQPDYYFSGDAQVSAALDNLMLTHGWRRFKWEDILSPSSFKPRFVPETNYHIIQAKVLNSASHRPAAGVKSYLSVPGKSVIFYNGLSKENGIVDFYTKGLSGVKPMVLQTNHADTALFSFDLLSSFSDQYSGRLMPAMSLASLPTNTLLINSINMQAQNIYLKERLNRIREVLPDSVPFYGSAREKYQLDDYTRFPTVEEVLREYVLSVGVRRRNGKPTMLVYTGEVNKGFFEEDPLVLMDGVPMFDRTKFFSYDPLKVKSVEVVPKRYFYGPDVYGGLIRFNTYKANLDGMELDPGAAILDYEGLQEMREFYSPRYDSQDQLSSRLPDFRNLLFWKPEVETAKDGKVQLSFYTSDRAGVYRAVIQGITVRGEAGSHSFEFTVK